MFLLQLFFNEYKAVIKTNTIIKSFVDFALKMPVLIFMQLLFKALFTNALYTNRGEDTAFTSRFVNKLNATAANRISPLQHRL